jgi:acetyltransferase-like isoleucine patch superfamily enzyme
MQNTRETKKDILTFHDLSSSKKSSSLEKYKNICVGGENYNFLIKYELLQILFSNFPGAFGIFFRQKFYRTLFKSIGKKVVIGRGVCFRQSKKISIGNDSIIDDFTRITIIGSNKARIYIGNNVFLGPYCVCSSRDACVKIEDYTSIGSHCRLGSMNGRLSIGKYVIIGAYSYIGGGNHSIADLNKPMVLQEFVSKGGVTIEDDVWIGAHVVVLDGVKIGRGSVIGAHSLVLKDIPDFSIAFGVPAKLHGRRNNENPS